MSVRSRGKGLRLVQKPGAVEASLWRRCRFEKNLSCRQTLFNRNQKVAKSIARAEHRKRGKTGLDELDFEQFAYEGLLEAIDRFDPLFGTPFSAFARPRIRGAVRDGVMTLSEQGALLKSRDRVERDRVNSVTGNAEGGPDQTSLDAARAMVLDLAMGFVLEEAEAVTSGVSAYQTREWIDWVLAVRQELEKLPPREKYILEQHYVQGVAFAQIASVLGVTRGRVSQLHAAGLALLRARLG